MTAILGAIHSADVEAQTWQAWDYWLDVLKPAGLPQPMEWL